MNEQERKRETAWNRPHRGLTASGTVCRARAGLRLRDSQQDSKLAGRKDRISASTCAYRPCMGARHIVTHTRTRILQFVYEVEEARGVGSRVGLDFDLMRNTWLLWSYVNLDFRLLRDFSVCESIFWIVATEGIWFPSRWNELTFRIKNSINNYFNMYPMIKLIWKNLMTILG